ncbi:hypothetical protein D6783_01665 [Candidatus Woesearchaeota archaeon]|nr:MAG: hypothetical protein D6783_01665 [Candidatus Woesearchaeota archaeon]
MTQAVVGSEESRKAQKEGREATGFARFSARFFASFFSFLPQQARQRALCPNVCKYVFFFFRSAPMNEGCVEGCR